MIEIYGTQAKEVFYFIIIFFIFWGGWGWGGGFKLCKLCGKYIFRLGKLLAVNSADHISAHVSFFKTFFQPF